MAQDTQDLDALFEQLAAQRLRSLAAAAAERPLPTPNGDAETCDPCDPYSVLQRVGTLTRNLHEALQQLGYTNELQGAVELMPDARSRLDYIANLTGTAAERVLALVEDGQQHLGQVASDVERLRLGWEKVFTPEATMDEFKHCVEQTRAFFAQVPDTLDHQHALLTEIMVAQNFHDLTGQVVKRIGSIVHNVEQQLVKLLVDAAPMKGGVAPKPTGPSGPAVHTGPQSDAVSNQSQVDELLASMGF